MCGRSSAAGSGVLITRNRSVSPCLKERVLSRGSPRRGGVWLCLRGVERGVVAEVGAALKRASLRSVAGRAVKAGRRPPGGGSLDGPVSGGRTMTLQAPGRGLLV